MRVMRRKDRQLSSFEQMLAIVERCDVLRLGIADGEYPYIVPVNFAYQVERHENQDTLCLYTHGAIFGRKYELLRRKRCCSFEMDLIHDIVLLPEYGAVTQRYESVMGEARVEFLEGDDKQHAIDDIFMARWELTRNFDYNHHMVPHTAVMRLVVTAMSGKANLPHLPAGQSLQ